MVGEILKVHKSLYKDYGEDILRNYVLYLYLKWMSLGLRDTEILQIFSATEKI